MKSDYKPVVQLILTKHTELFVLTYNDANGDAYELKVSGQHPFWVADKGWVAARQLAIDDKLVITDDTVVAITNITIEKAEPSKTFTTYNFEVADFHTYYVLQEGKKDGIFAVLVHNAKRLKDGCGSRKGWRDHHLASDKHKTYFTERFRKITDKYELDLGEDWNILRIQAKYHFYSHSPSYHNFVLREMKLIDKELKGLLKNKERFKKLFDENVRQVVKKKPKMLQWK